jgi:hypothetical protein
MDFIFLIQGEFQWLSQPTAVPSSSVRDGVIGRLPASQEGCVRHAFLLCGGTR